MYLGFPVVDVLMLFLGGNVVERNGELQWTGGLLDLALEVTRRGHQLRCAKRREVALLQLALNAPKLFTEGLTRSVVDASHFSRSASGSMAWRFWISNWYLRLQAMSVGLVTLSSTMSRA